jgi:hypothetical protein
MRALHQNNYTTPDLVQEICHSLACVGLLVVTRPEGRRLAADHCSTSVSQLESLGHLQTYRFAKGPESIKQIAMHARPPLNTHSTSLMKL